MKEALQGLHAWSADPAEVYREFHRTVHRASDNQVLVDVLGGLWDRSERFRRFSGRSLDGADIAAKHEAMAHSIISGDAERADKLMAIHMTATTPAWRNHEPEVQSADTRISVPSSSGSAPFLQHRPV